jgi:hypothetical protein
MPLFHFLQQVYSPGDLAKGRLWSANGAPRSVCRTASPIATQCSESLGADGLPQCDPGSLMTPCMWWKTQGQASFQEFLFRSILTRGTSSTPWGWSMANPWLPSISLGGLAHSHGCITAGAALPAPFRPCGLSQWLGSSTLCPLGSSNMPPPRHHPFLCCRLPRPCPSSWVCPPSQLGFGITPPPPLRDIKRAWRVTYSRTLYMELTPLKDPLRTEIFWLTLPVILLTYPSSNSIDLPLQ